jgi:D-tyrosyl-tRNA(Tyr) deacylase
VLLVGFTATDTHEHVAWMAEKVNGLRLFADAEDKMNLALADVGGAVLVVSQFTLYGDARKGRRPSFIDAARPEQTGHSGLLQSSSQGSQATSSLSS